jgi:hypothetical protein
MQDLEQIQTTYSLLMKWNYILSLEKYAPMHIFRKYPIYSELSFSIKYFKVK